MKMVFKCRVCGELYEDDSHTFSNTEGAVNATNASNAVAGNGTKFTHFEVGSKIKIVNNWYTISTITNDTAIVLSSAFNETTVTNHAYIIVGQQNTKKCASCGYDNSMPINPSNPSADTTQINED